MLGQTHKFVRKYQKNIGVLFKAFTLTQKCLKTFTFNLSIVIYLSYDR